MPDKQKEKEPEVEVEAPEKVDKEELKEVEVEVDEGTKPEPPKYVTAEEFRKQNSRFEYQSRQLNKAMKTIESLTEQLQHPIVSPPTNTEIPDDISKLTSEQINQIAEVDWQRAVDIRAELKARKVLEAERRKQQREQQQQYLNSLVESSRQVVLKRYPHIEDETTYESQLYRQVLNDNPRLLSNVDGPEIAMYRMEELMRNQGKQPEPIRQEVQVTADKEVQRRARVGAGSLPKGNAPGAGSKVTLTQAEIDFAKANNIPFARVAAFKDKSERDLREGVTVDE